MRTSWLDRILALALVLLVSAWAVSWAVHTIISVLPTLAGIAAVMLGGSMAWRWHRNRDAGW